MASKPAVSVSPADAVVAALGLPGEARLDQRVPKKTLLEHTDLVSADRTLLNEHIAELTWVAALKPETCGLRAVDDGLHPAVEVQVLRARLKAQRHPPRLVALCHRVVPYPVLWIVEDGDRTRVSVARKRTAGGAANGLVLDDVPLTIEVGAAAWTAAWLSSLALPHSGADTLASLYGHWWRCMAGALGAQCTGLYGVPATAEGAAQLLEDLDEVDGLQRELKKLRQSIKRETQLARRIELNDHIRQATTDLENVQRRLQEQT